MTSNLIYQIKGLVITGIYVTIFKYIMLKKKQHYMSLHY